MLFECLGFGLFGRVSRYVMCDIISKSLCIYCRRIHADVIVYIFAHLHMVLRTEGNLHVLDMN